jgi:hypothetical protein
MKISYAVTVCDEFIEIQQLLAFLLQNKRQQDEIVVLVDLTKNEPTSELLGYLYKLSSNNKITLIEDSFDGHFANWKNKLSSLCKGDYIFNIDADELPNSYLIQYLPTIIENNPEVDFYWVPRENFVEGITQEHIQRWRWNLDNQNRINFPDKQGRIYKNSPDIKWQNKVHEVLVGYKQYSSLPEVTEFSINHTKTIQKQEKQNNYYNTL